MIPKRFCMRGVPAAVVALVLGTLLLPVAGLGQIIAGRWAAMGKTLDDGEQERVILDLKLDDNDLSGTLRRLGYSVQVKGKVTGSHFELSVPEWNPGKPNLVGELENGELHIVVDGDQHLVAKPANMDEELPPFPYLEPPQLHKVEWNGLAKTPPMGWNSWNLFAGKIDDKTVREMADAMVTSGMRDAGYIYLNIDDTWEGVRDAHGNLQGNRKFPDMKALADYVHSKGLKLGVYSGPGPRTCADYPASYGHEDQDAKTWASWGVDYLKYDWCSAGEIYKHDALQAIYQKMGDALHSTGRPIVYSLCEYGMGDVQKWGADVGGNLWRTTDDIRDEWASMIDNVEKQAGNAEFAGPGHWNDPDMLEIGNGHMSEDEYKTHMSLWAMVAAPLLAGNDLRNMTEATKGILLNKEVIAIDQDPLGKQAIPKKDGDLETWLKPMADGELAVAIVNHAQVPVKTTLRASELPVHGGVKRARDLWAHREAKFSKHGEYTETIPSHGVLMLRVSAK